MTTSGPDIRPSHRRVPRHRTRPHAVRGLIIASGALFVAALCALPAGITDAEENAFDAVNHLPDFLAWVLWVPMQAGAGLGPLVMAGVAWLIWRRLRPALDLLVAGWLAYFLAKVVKQWLGRGRPSAFFDDVHLHGHAATTGDAGLGFPSGHTAVAFAMAVVVMPYLTVRWRVAVGVLACVVALARLYFGAHLPLDVIGGAALGVAVGAWVHLVMDLVTHRH